MERLLLYEYRDDGGSGWGRAVIIALAVAALILALFTYWFAVADRYEVFLYFHDMGPHVPDTSPFSRVTSSRYWMAGLVTSGAVMLLYLIGNWIVGRMVDTFHPPAWWRVWLASVPLLLVGLPAILMNVNAPTLPPLLALQVTVVTLAGLALALVPGELAARDPSRLLWLAADGWGLALILLTLSHMEDFRLWLGMSSHWRLTWSLFLMLAGLAWLLLLSFIHARFRIAVEGTKDLILASFCVTYLFLPLVHHTVGTDGYFYLTDSDNFFARSLGYQIWAWLIAVLIAWCIVRLRSILARGQEPKAG